MKKILLFVAAMSSVVAGCSSGAGRFVSRCDGELSLSADSVAVTVDVAEAVWNSAPWANEYGRAVFEEEAREMARKILSMPLKVENTFTLRVKDEVRNRMQNCKN